MSFDSIVNRGDYFSAHYLAEVLPKDLKKSGGLLARWSEDEKADRITPRRGLRELRKQYFADRPFFADVDARLREGELIGPDDRAEWRKALAELHGDVLRALGFAAQPRELTVERAGREYAVPVAYADQHLVAVECGWAADVDAALDGDRAGLLAAPIRLDGGEQLASGTKLASWLFAADVPPRYVLILAGGVAVLADRATWGEGRYLAVSLDVALGRNNPAELEVIAALFGADSLLPPEEGGSEPLAELLTNSRNHAVGVSADLRKGLKDSVELIANEVLNRIRQAEMRLEDGTVRAVRPEDIMEPGALAKELGKEALRYLYRILFLLYAEARPELGILPTDDEDYGRGYSLSRLGDLVVRDLTGEEARNSFHLYESLDLLFRLVNGDNPKPGGSDGSPGSAGPAASTRESLRFEPLRADLFNPEKTRLIGRAALTVPGYDEDDPTAPKIDTRLRNATLHRVLQALMLTKGRRKERGGFISYAQLGINQLGAVYEGLMSYTGFISTEELYEVAKNGDSHGGTWTIPASKVPDYPEDVFVRRVDEDGHKTEEYVRYVKGSFVYRLAGRDRETSASYYTPESLTQVTVELALKHRLDQDGTVTPAREILQWKICEPALGSGAFLNEAINQVSAEYLRRRQQELGVSVDPERYEEELQRVKAYVALHNSYGVDLNETAIELAEVSVWLNVMHPGLQAPWFGLHLRHGNSLIGAGRRVYDAARLTKGSWLKEAPEDLPFSAGKLPPGKVHHFLLPAEGWGAVAGAKEARELAPVEAKKLADWRKKMRAKVSDKKKQGQKLTQLQRLQALSGRAEYLWDLVVQRLTISEREISRKIDVWGADWIDQPANAVTREKVLGDLIAPGTPYWRLKKVMDAWCALWFWPLDRTGLLDGSDDVYTRLAPPILSAEPVRPTATAGSPETAHEASPSAETLPAAGLFPAAEETIGFRVRKQEALFGMGDEQLDLDSMAHELKEARAARPKPAPKRPSLAPLRQVIPLADLDDWLDFAEAMLGRVDIDHGDTEQRKGLTTVFTTLDEVEHHEDDIVFWMRMESPAKTAERFPWVQVVDDIAEQQGFFHWELQFAQVFDRGGFDLQVGNPPWVRPDWNETAVLAERDPWFKLIDEPSIEIWEHRKTNLLANWDARKFFLYEYVNNMAIANVLASPAFYPLLAGTRPDLYRAFMCQVWAHLGASGTSGLLHPDTHLEGVGVGSIRSAAYKHLRIHGSFINGGNWAFASPISRTLEFGVHIYGRPREISFLNASYLYGANVLPESLAHNGCGDFPGIKYRGTWDRRPHKGRVIHVTVDTLKRWQELLGRTSDPVGETQLVHSVSIAEQEAMAALTRIGNRLGGSYFQTSSGYNEKTDRVNGYIVERLSAPGEWKEIVLQGPHFGVGTPLAKQPPKMGNADKAVNLNQLPVDAVPTTKYRRSCDWGRYLQKQSHWLDFERLKRLQKFSREELLKKFRDEIDLIGVLSDKSVDTHDVINLGSEDYRRLLERLATRPYTEFYRLAWRVMIADNGERSLFAAVMPPGPAHVDAVNTMAFPSFRDTVLVAGFWAALPLDYMLRITGRSHLRVAEVHVMPAVDVLHPLAEALLLRTLRLNCLVEVYAPLWEKLYDPTWVSNEKWAVGWPGLAPLENVASKWARETPLRSEAERRAALVEIDALVAVWLGIGVEELIAAYRSRYGVLSNYENEMWFDSNGRKIAGNFNTFGHGQTKEQFKQLMAHLDPEVNGPVPDGYTAPFYKADREAEYRQAHAVFSERLRQSGWQASAAPEGEGTA
ncbi:class I SAM-dependent DNA methyltransferase [Streptosporangium sp. NPDC049644]|uniref:Eco57I restriction-modification methylase domain-containing protein n=1 Tax=Streptosporangium sp. NPDC049644 TaxID=3155507 RepID=UPI0034155952